MEAGGIIVWLLAGAVFTQRTFAITVGFCDPLFNFVIGFNLVWCNESYVPSVGLFFLHRLSPFGRASTLLCCYMRVVLYSQGVCVVLVCIHNLSYYNHGVDFMSISAVDLLFKVLSAGLIPAAIWINALSVDVALLKSRLDSNRERLEKVELQQASILRGVNETQLSLKGIVITVNFMKDLLTEIKSEYKHEH